MVLKTNSTLINGTNCKNGRLSVEEKSRFHLFILKNDDSKSVKALGTSELDFAKIKKLLKSGHSIFISYENKTRLPLKKSEKKSKDQEFFSHI